MFKYFHIMIHICVNKRMKFIFKYTQIILFSISLLTIKIMYRNCLGQNRYFHAKCGYFCLPKLLKINTGGYFRER